MALSPNNSQLRRALSEELCLQDLSPRQFRQTLCKLRRLENHELFSSFSAGSCPGPIFDANQFSAHLWDAVREVVPFSPKRLHFVRAQQPLILPGRDGFAAVLLNLICNSLVYAGPQPILELSVFRHHQQAVFLLRDNGPGLFQNTFRQPYPGGLSLAQKFSELQGGTFLLENRGYKGISSLLALPLASAARPSPSPGTQALLANRLSPVFVQLSPICILPDNW